MVDTWWKDKPDFWDNKTAGNEAYIKQRKELGGILFDVINEVQARSILDVCGYKGAMSEYLPSTLHYANYDIVNGFDVTREWAKQGADEEFDISFTSLSLITFDRKTCRYIIDQMIARTKKAIVFFEEYDQKQRTETEKIDDDFGGKWHHNLQRIAVDLHSKGLIKHHRYYLSKLNPQWSAFILYI